MLLRQGRGRAPLAGVAAVAAALVAGSAAAGARGLARPNDPQNITVIALRPANLSDTLVNKNSADAAGDLFFWITDRLVAPYACRHSNNSWWGCKEQRTLNHDSVYTKTVVEVDGTWPTTTSLGTCEVNSTSFETSCYAACNPADVSGSKWSCTCHAGDASPPRYQAPCDIVGRAYLAVRYAECADGCRWVNDHWKSAIAQVLGGLWYSTTAQGQCDGGSSTVSCRWREVAKLWRVNATCANANVYRLVKSRGASCFAACPPGERNDPSSDCATRCFFSTVIGRGPLFPNATGAGVAGSDLVAAFEAAFVSEDPAKGGCKNLLPVE